MSDNNLESLLNKYTQAKIETQKAEEHLNTCHKTEYDIISEVVKTSGTGPFSLNGKKVIAIKRGDIYFFREARATSKK